MKVFSLLTVLFSFSAIAQSTISPPAIIPQPVSIQTGNGIFTLTNKTVIIAVDEEDKRITAYLNNYLQQALGFTLAAGNRDSKNYIRFFTRKFIKAPDKSGYQLTVTADGVAIEGDTYEGTFYGLQSLLQLLPASRENASLKKIELPFVTITDYPRFNYRGMHLDVSRHFFPVAFIKKYIDYLALHKLNYFHWHLTDDQGWRIEIKKYPELTAKGAYRNGTVTGRYPGTGNDNIRYGGYYTQEEVKDIVRYAAERYITVIPEIEMPGHASAAIAAYPWLSCFPEKETIIPSYPSDVSKNASGKKVQETWGVFEDIFCAGKDSTFIFLENVLDEILPLFPAPLIHIGGDEAPKTHWKNCPYCAARIKEKGLKDEHGLQSYFIRRIEKYINSKGKNIIGWDEILEGGLAPNATVMSWRGEQGGIEAAKQNHNVIMTPGKPVYFDYSQTKNEDSLVIGGYNSLEAVYGYEPVPKELNVDEAKFIMGAQANVWTEYMAYPSKVEYMVFPRMSALSEVLWSPKKKRSWKDFEQRLQKQFKRYDLWKVNYSKAYFDAKVSLLPTKNFDGVQIKVDPVDKKGTIKYEILDHHYPLLYTSPLVIKNKSQLVVTNYRNKKLINQVSINISFNKATGKKISITAPPTDKYPGQGGAFSLVNGIYSNKGLSFPDWLGWIGDDMVATIDLGKLTKIDSVRMHTINQNGSWVYLPKYVEVQTSVDGKKFITSGEASAFVSDTLTMGWITVSLPKTKSRYIKFIAKNYGLIPEGQPGAGNKAWLFADEIQVY